MLVTLPDACCSESGAGRKGAAGGSRRGGAGGALAAACKPGGLLDRSLLARDAARAAMTFVTAGLSYLLMLAAMSFNVSIFFAVISGLFGRRRGAPLAAGCGGCGRRCGAACDAQAHRGAPRPGPGLCRPLNLLSRALA